MHSVSRQGCSVQQLLPACPEDRIRERVRRLQRQLFSKSDGDSSGASLRVLGGTMDRFADLLIGTAAADVATHGFIDIGVRWTGLLRQKRRRRHDLTGLAIAALWNIDFDPRLLNRMAAVGGKTFD